VCILQYIQTSFLAISKLWDVIDSGCAKGWPDGACAPAVNPCAPAMPRQASRRHFILLCSASSSSFTVPYFTPTEANFLALMAPEGRILKANFQKLSRGHATRAPFCGIWATPSFTTCAVQAPHCWDPDYCAHSEDLVPHLCSSKNNSWRRHWL